MTLFIVRLWEQVAIYIYHGSDQLLYGHCTATDKLTEVSGIQTD